MSDSRIVPPTNITSEGNGFRYGLLTGAVLIAYTLIAALLGFFGRIEAGALDLALLTAGAVVAIMHLKKAKGNRLTYFQGFATGIITAMVASVVLGLFVIIFSAISPRLMDLSRASDLFGFDLSVVIAFLAIILLGSMWGMITSLVAMQYFKSPDHKPIEGIE